MRAAALIVAMLLTSTMANTIEPLCPFKWLLRSPSGAVYELDCNSAEFVMNEPGGWLVHLTVYYQHVTPSGEPYAYTESTVYVVGENPDFIFSDGFESASPLSRWTATQGGQE
jgi:hypothetical protein